MSGVNRRVMQMFALSLMASGFKAVCYRFSVSHNESLLTLLVSCACKQEMRTANSYRCTGKLLVPCEWM
jgi:hypothetical protein